MTALAGRIDTATDAATRARAVSNMLDLVHGRGADGVGVWSAPDAPVTLGARLQATLDLTMDGRQPQASARAPIAVVLDGYIANGASIRRELEETGITLLGHGDAELLAEAAAHWGLNRLLQKLEGAFAFALWDGEAAALHIVRDRMGARRLFVAQDGTGFAFASDAAALGRPKTPANAKVLAALLTLGYIPAPLAIYDGVISLPAGARMMLRANDTVLPEPEVWWSPATAIEESSLRGGAGDDASQRLEKLRASLATESQRLDVSAALYDDGGHEARLLRLALDRSGGKPPRDLQASTPDAVSVQTAFDALAHMPEPVTDPRAVLWWWTLSSATAQVAIMAPPMAPIRHGADIGAAKNIWWRGALARLWPSRFGHWKKPPAWESYKTSRQGWPDPAVLCQNTYEAAWYEPRLDTDWTGDRAAYFEFCAGLRENDLPTLDRIGGWFGVDVRAPLADPRLLDFAMPQPFSGAPDIAGWMRGPLRVRLQSLFTEVRLEALGIKKPAVVLEAWQAFLDGSDTPARRLWALGCFLAHKG